MTAKSERLAELRARAESLTAAGNWGPEARAVNREILQNASTDVPAINRLARCFAEAGRTNDAVRLWRAVLTIDPLNALAANRIATHERRLADTAAARVMTDPVKARRAGIEARHAGAGSRAEALLRRSLELEASMPTQIALAAVLRDRGRLVEAATMYEEILSRAFAPAAAVGLAAVRRDQNRSGDAISLCLQVLADGFDAAAATVLAAAYKDVGEFGLAEQWASQAAGRSGGDKRALAVLMSNRAKARRP